MCVCGISVGSTVYEIFLDLNKYFTTGGVSPWSGLRVPCDKYLQLLVSGGGAGQCSDGRIILHGAVISR